MSEIRRADIITCIRVDVNTMLRIRKMITGHVSILTYTWFFDVEEKVWQIDAWVGLPYVDTTFEVDQVQVLTFDSKTEFLNNLRRAFADDSFDPQVVEW